MASFLSTTNRSIYRTVVFANRIAAINWYGARMINGSSPSGSSENEDQKAPEGPDNKERHRDAEKEPLPEWPDGVNPHTGEKGGPKGLEPTRYGDWERKGRVTDF